MKFEHIEEGVTVAKQIDEVTGLSTLVVIDAKRRVRVDQRRTSAGQAMNEAGEEVKIPGTEHAVTICFPIGALIVVRDAQQVGVGEVLARIPTESQKTRDITGGLPRVAELFEARSPKDAGMLAEVTGTVTFGKETKGKQRLIITDLEGKEHEFLIPKDKHMLVHDGQVVNRGELDRRRPRRSARHPASAGDRGACALHRRRGAGRLSPAGREDQRQAHRGDRPPDAAPGADQRPGRCAVHHRRAGRAV